MKCHDQQIGMRSLNCMNAVSCQTFARKIKMMQKVKGMIQEDILNEFAVQVMNQ